MTALALVALLLAAGPDGTLRCVDPGSPLATTAPRAPTAPAPALGWGEIPRGAPASADSLEAYWDEAAPFPAFYDGVTRRARLWERNYTQGEVPPELVERARAVGGTWRLLAVAVDACSDSVNTLPYLALLAEAVPGLELRVLDPERGRALMEARPTADGRAATPTVVLLDASFEDAGCFIERPRPLKEWIEEKEHEVGGPTLYEGKMLWYDQDAGRSTLEEVVGLLEAAAAGAPVCRG